MTSTKNRLGWFLPETPDVLGMLRHQGAISADAMAALVDWAGGDATGAERLRGLEHDADEVKRELRIALRRALDALPARLEKLFDEQAR